MKKGDRVRTLVQVPFSTTFVPVGSRGFVDDIIPSSSGRDWVLVYLDGYPGRTAFKPDELEGV